MYDNISSFGGFVFGLFLIFCFFCILIIGLVFLLAKGVDNYQTRKKNNVSNEEVRILRAVKENQ